MTARRIAREYLAQIFAFAITMFDRLVLVGVLIRLWGVDIFAAWTVALSVAGMVAIFDFGLNLYFGNRLFFAVEQGEKDRARHILGAGNFALACASLFGAVAVIGLYLLFRNTDEGVNQETTLLWAVIILAVATAARQAMAAQYAVYRAHQQFFRQTIIFSLGDLLRIATVIAFSIGFASTAAFAQSADEELQPRFKRAEIVSTQGAVQQGASKPAAQSYNYLTETSPN